MAEQVNPTAPDPAANPKPGDPPAKGSGDPAVPEPKVTGSDPKPETPKGEQPEPQRKLQSERDKAKAEAKTTQEQLEELQEHVYGKEVETVLSSFLEQNSKKFPDVEMADLASAESLAEEHLVAEATRVQGRFDKVRNDALTKVQEVPEQEMTEAERAEALKKLEKQPDQPGQSRFGQFLNLTRSKTR